MPSINEIILHIMLSMGHLHFNRYRIECKYYLFKYGVKHQICNLSPNHVYHI